MTHRIRVDLRPYSRQYWRYTFAAHALSAFQTTKTAGTLSRTIQQNSPQELAVKAVRCADALLDLLEQPDEDEVEANNEST